MCVCVCVWREVLISGVRMCVRGVCACMCVWREVLISECVCVCVHVRVCVCGERFGSSGRTLCVHVCVHMHGLSCHVTVSW